MVSYEIDLLNLEGLIVGSTHLLYLIEHFPVTTRIRVVNIEGHSSLGL